MGVLALNIVCLLACTFLVYVLVAFHDEQRRGQHAKRPEDRTAQASTRVSRLRKQLRSSTHGIRKSKMKRAIRLS